MKILLVSHLFPPRHHAGVEVYSAALARELSERGHAVEVFTTTKDVARNDLQIIRRRQDGIVVHELVNNLFYRSFEETFDYPPVEQRFAELLDQVRPEIVHFQHLMYLSLGCARRVAERGIPVFFTLHDFWLQCARFGQRIRFDGEICHTIDLVTCARCMASTKVAQTGLQRRAARVVAGIRRLSGLDLGRPLTALGRRVGGRAKRAPAIPSPDRVAAMEAALSERERRIRVELLPAVDAFISPSQFLLEELRRWGIPAEKLEHLRVGIDPAPLESFRRAPAEVLRVSYAGTLVPHKGAHVLLEAWERLPERRGAQLTLYGNPRHRPGYVARLGAQARRTGARLAGEFPHAEVARVLGETDLLVVPSIWYENSPLIILEALATGTPLLVSDLGGMRELVAEGISGFRFPAGDSAALAARLAELLGDPGALARLYPDGPLRIRTIEDDALDLEARYQVAVEGGAR